MKTSIHIENKIRPKASRNGLKYHIKTFGCQMNEHDSEKIAGIFNNDGMTKSDDIEKADVLFVNTCTIRENADDKLYGKLSYFLFLVSSADSSSFSVVSSSTTSTSSDSIRPTAL